MWISPEGTTFACLHAAVLDALTRGAFQHRFISKPELWSGFVQQTPTTIATWSPAYEIMRAAGYMRAPDA